MRMICEYCIKAIYKQIPDEKGIVAICSEQKSIYYEKELVEIPEGSCKFFTGEKPKRKPTSQTQLLLVEDTYSALPKQIRTTKKTLNKERKNHAKNT